MSYVEMCSKHGQYHGELCGDCFDDLKEENTKLRSELELTEDMLNSADKYNQEKRTAHVKEIELFESEIKQLRKALEYIHEMADYIGTRDTIQQTCCEALRVKK